MRRVTERAGAVPWRRVLVESVAVVLSILLAFGIDAAWGEMGERRRETVLLRGLLAEFEAIRPDLLQRGNGARRMVTNTRLLRDLVGEGAGHGLLQVPDSLILASLGGPTFQPATNTLEAALASGDIDLIRQAEIREHLAQWRVTLLDTFESEKEVRAIAIEQIEPSLARELALGPYFDAVLLWDQEEVAPSGHARITPSLELSGALATRVFYQQFAEDGLAKLLLTLNELVGLLNEELGS